MCVCRSIWLVSCCWPYHFTFPQWTRTLSPKSENWPRSRENWIEINLSSTHVWSLCMGPSESDGNRIIFRHNRLVFRMVEISLQFVFFFSYSIFRVFWKCIVMVCRLVINVVRWIDENSITRLHSNAQSISFWRKTS